MLSGEFALHPVAPGVTLEANMETMLNPSPGSWQGIFPSFCPEQGGDVLK